MVWQKLVNWTFAMKRAQDLPFPKVIQGVPDGSDDDGENPLVGDTAPQSPLDHAPRESTDESDEAGHDEEDAQGAPKYPTPPLHMSAYTAAMALGHDFS